MLGRSEPRGPSRKRWIPLRYGDERLVQGGKESGGHILFVTGSQNKGLQALPGFATTEALKSKSRL